ncbi:DUF222 domain-containing protein [Candidatus Poriferisodalis sp.]|uniref:HNH endonuclease signature motif containing protein n=1 Tax=Candidatus Poriferisodalis sp. TaxID=3101277 RepID=UPI003B02E295
MFSQVQQALQCLGAALDSVEAAPTDELRRALCAAKSLRTRVELLETKAAALVARRECHGDGGAGLLNQLGGRSRAEAARNTRTDAELAQLPAVASGVAAGEISFANAAKLVQTARSVGHQAVRDCADLARKAKALPDDEFAHAAQRWTLRHRSGDDLAKQHRRNRRNRSVRFWNGDDGSVQMRGAFDAEMGARIQRRLRHQSELLRQADRRRQRQHTSGVAPEDSDRTQDQRMADALNGLLADAHANADMHATTEASSSAADDAGGGAARAVGLFENAPTEFSGASRLNSDRPAHTLPDPVAALPSDNSVLPADTPKDKQAESRVARLTTDRHAQPSGIEHGPAASAAAPSSNGHTPSNSAERGRTDAQIIVRADLHALLGQRGGAAEIPAVGPIPAETLQRLACNNDLSLVIFADKLTPLCETTPSRAPTAAQRRALIARDGACIGCGAPPDECEAHHIVPWTCGGKTRIDNLVLVCWSCHDRIHDHNWRIQRRDGRYRLAVPDPARPPNPARSRKPGRRLQRPAPPSGVP